MRLRLILDFQARGNCLRRGYEVYAALSKASCFWDVLHNSCPAPSCQICAEVAEPAKTRSQDLTFLECLNAVQVSNF